MRNTQVLRLCWCAHVFLHKDELSVPASKNGDMIPFSDYMFSVTSVYDTITAIKRTSMLEIDAFILFFRAIKASRSRSLIEGLVVRTPPHTHTHESSGEHF